LMSGRPLVCPDLSHVRTMFPFRDGVNAVFCRPDFADIGTIAAALRSDPAAAHRIGRDGRRAWRDWTRRWPEILESGLVSHVRNELRRGDTAGIEIDPIVVSGSRRR
jgi:hypothetical protein